MSILYFIPSLFVSKNTDQCDVDVSSSIASILIDWSKSLIKFGSLSVIKKSGGCQSLMKCSILALG